MEKIDISQSVKTLEFGSKYEARIQRIFREFDIKTIRDLCQWPGKDLVRVRDMGRKSIEEIEDVLERYNLRLGMLGKELDEYAGIENSVQDEEEEAGRLEPGRSQEGLLESLLEQACMLHLTKREEKIFRYMIKNLDASGYLSVNFGELCAGLGIEETEGERIWENFGRLEPCGIGARSLKECLLMQLSYLAEDGGAVIDIVQNGTMRTEILAARIISNHLDLLGKNQMKQLARACSCKLEEVLLAAARIRELNPKPGSGYGDESYDKYIVPDIIISQTEHGFEMQLSDETLPQIAINPYYLSLMKQKDTETEAKDYIEGKIRQAEWVCQCIGQRNQTLSRLAEEILCVQGEFFAKGSGKLAPWTQKQAAKSLGGSEPDSA